MEPWKTAISNSNATHIWIRGHDITSLMRTGTFVDTVFLLHAGRIPSANERRLLDAILTAVADHGAGAPSCATARLAASGNRQSPSAAIAAGAAVASKLTPLAHAADAKHAFAFEFVDYAGA